MCAETLSLNQSKPFYATIPFHGISALGTRSTLFSKYVSQRSYSLPFEGESRPQGRSNPPWDPLLEWRGPFGHGSATCRAKSKNSGSNRILPIRGERWARERLIPRLSIADLCNERLLGEWRVSARFCTEK